MLDLTAGVYCIDCRNEQEDCICHYSASCVDCGNNEDYCICPSRIWDLSSQEILDTLNKFKEDLISLDEEFNNHLTENTREKILLELKKIKSLMLKIKGHLDSEFYGIGYHLNP